MELAAGCIWDQLIFSRRSLRLSRVLWSSRCFSLNFAKCIPALRLLLSAAIAGRAVSANPHATGLGRGHHLGAGDAALWFVAGLPLRYLICVILLGIAFIPSRSIFGLKPYQQQRITAFTHPTSTNKVPPWAINQSLIAIGSGGWSGKGIQGAEHADRAGVSTRYGCA